MTTTGWEYLIRICEEPFVDVISSEEYQVKMLNDLGKQGWEIYAVTRNTTEGQEGFPRDTTRYYLKRQISE